MMRDIGAKMAAPVGPDMRPFESLLHEISRKLDDDGRGAPDGELAATIRELGQRIDQRVGPPLDTRPLEEALRALHDRLEGGAPARLDVKFVEEAADLLAERLERQRGGRVDADLLASQIADIHDRLDALQSARRRRAGAARRRPDRRTRCDPQRAAGAQRDRRPMISPAGSPNCAPTRMRPTSARRAGSPTCRIFSNGWSAGSADWRTRSRAATKRALRHPPLRWRRLRRRSATPPSRSAPWAARRCATCPSASRRRRRARSTAPISCSSPARRWRARACPNWAISRPRARSTPISPPRAAPPRRRWGRGPARAALAPPPAEGKNTIAGLGAQALAFATQRRRPLLLAIVLVAAVAMLAAIELRGGHLPLLQKSELAPPAAQPRGDERRPSPRRRRRRRRRSRHLADRRDRLAGERRSRRRAN